MMKKLFLSLLTLLFLVGCVNESALPGNQSVVDNTRESTDSEVAEESQQVEETPEVALPGEVRGDGIRSAWTDYRAYAQPNEEGYAYYIHDDPDISSEIFPLTDESSSDILLFTFDDAPQAPDSYAIEIATVLKDKDVNAVFLVNGMYIATEVGAQITKEIHDMGFEIGNHTTYHPFLREMTYDEQYFEIANTNELIYEITGEPVRWFRPPFGQFNLDTIMICNDLGLQLINWSFGYDWMDEYLDGPALEEVSLNNHYLRGGANILMHDRPWTLEALPGMIDGYRAMGYHIVDPYLIQHQENSTAPME